MSDEEGSYHGDENDVDDDVISDDADLDEEEPQAKRRKIDNGGTKAPTFNLKEFLDLEAEVSDEDEDEALNEVEFDEEDEGFVARENDEVGSERDRTMYLNLDRQREERSVAEIAKAIEQRHAAYVDNEVNEEDLGRSGIAQQARQPSVHDPKLWIVRCTPGLERQFVTQLMLKFLVKQQDQDRLHIFSVTALDHIKGYIYIEAYKEAHVREAVMHLGGVFAPKITLVPLKEMVSVLSVNKKKIHLQKDSFVRIKRGLYKGDIACVFDHDDGSPFVYCLVVPRLNMQRLKDPIKDDDEIVEDEEEEHMALPGQRVPRKRNFRKRKRTPDGPRPAARLFKASEIHNILGQYADIQSDRDPISGEPVQKFNGNIFKNGLLAKKFSIRLLETENVIPTLEEMQKFQGTKLDDEDEEDITQKEKQERYTLEQTRRLQATRKIAFQKNDNVIVVEGDLKNLVGRVHSMDGDTIHIVSREFNISEPIPVPRSSLQKFFRTGDHVKVESGSYAGETGLIVKVTDNIATLISDVTQREVKVLTSDIRECAAVSPGLKFGDYMLHDLVQLDLNTVGVITFIERDSAQVLDTNGKMKSVKIQSIRTKKDSKKAFGRDCESSIVGAGDLVNVIRGPCKDEKGVIKHIFHAFSFIHSKTRQQDGGMFVVRTKDCKLQGTSKNKQSGIHGNRTQQGGPGDRNMAQVRGQYGFGQKAVRRRNDELLHKNVQITRGPWKSYLGLVKDTDDTHVVVELQTNAKRVRIPRDNITDISKASSTRSRPRDDFYDVMRTPNVGMTPLHPGLMTPRGTPMTPAHDPFNPNAPMTPLHQTPSASSGQPDDEDEEEEEERERDRPVRPSTSSMPSRSSSGANVEPPSPAIRTPFPVEVPPRTPAEFLPPPRTPGPLSEAYVPPHPFMTSAITPISNAGTPRTPYTPLPGTPRTPGGGMEMGPPRTPNSELLSSGTPNHPFTPAPRTPGGMVDFDGSGALGTGGPVGHSLPGNLGSGLSHMGLGNLGGFLAGSMGGMMGGMMGGGRIPVSTPSTPSTPRTPNTPGTVHAPSTPQTPGVAPTPTSTNFADNNNEVDSDDVVLVPGMEVEFDDSYKSRAYMDKVGVIKQVNGNVCTVIITKSKSGINERGGAPFQINATYLSPRIPEKKDKLIVVRGDKKGHRGTLVGIDGTSQEAIVKLDQGGEIIVLKMEWVAKLADDA